MHTSVFCATGSEGFAILESEIVLGKALLKDYRNIDFTLIWGDHQNLHIKSIERF